MQLYALSDTHGNLNVTLPDDADLILHAGDICPNFRGNKFDQRHQQRRFIYETYLPWKGTSPLHATYGNHDYLDDAADINIGIYADYLMRLNNLEVWFSPWSPLFGKGWAWMDPAEDLKRHYDAIPAGIDILVTHGPPYGYGDTVAGAVWVGWNRDEDPHLGSHSLLDTINLVHPKVVICGHIHTGHGRYEHTTPDGHTVVIYNVSLLDEGYNLAYGITKIEEFA